MMGHTFSPNSLDGEFQFRTDDSMGLMMSGQNSENGYEAMHAMMHGEVGSAAHSHGYSQPSGRAGYSADFLGFFGLINMILFTVLLVALIRYFWVKGGTK